jgi:hypothetical protein
LSEVGEKQTPVVGAECCLIHDNCSKTKENIKLHQGSTTQHITSHHIRAGTYRDARCRKHITSSPGPPTRLVDEKEVLQTDSGQEKFDSIQPDCINIIAAVTDPKNNNHRKKSKRPALGLRAVESHK